MERTTALLQLEGIPGATGPVPFILRGPAEAHVFFEGANEGDAFDDDGNGLGEVETELVSLNLTDGNVTLDPEPGDAIAWSYRGTGEQHLRHPGHRAVRYRPGRQLLRRVLPDRRCRT